MGHRFALSRLDVAHISASPCLAAVNPPGLVRPRGDRTRSDSDVHTADARMLGTAVSRARRRLLAGIDVPTHQSGWWSGPMRLRLVSQRLERALLLFWKRRSV